MEHKMKTALFCTMPIIKNFRENIYYYCKNFSELVAVSILVLLCIVFLIQSLIMHFALTMYLQFWWITNIVLVIWSETEENNKNWSN